MSIEQFFYENAWNIVIGIGTGIISSIFVSKIFLVYQDIKNDFLEVVKNISAYKNCYIIFSTYCNDKFPMQYEVNIPTNYNNSKTETYRKIKEISWKELDSLNCIYTKYMDKKLTGIIKEHEDAICEIFQECDIKYQKDECMKKKLDILEGVMLKYNSYQKSIFNRTLYLVFTDKLIMVLIFLFIISLIIA